MKLQCFAAVILAVISAPVALDRRRPPGQGPPPPGPPPSSNVTSDETDLGFNTTGLQTMNITSNGTEYYNVLYINETTMERVAIDLGFFTIPAGCYPCVGAHWCANILQPPSCSNDPGCDFTDQVEGCEDMFPSADEKIATCEECHANNSDYCIHQNICVDMANDSCINQKDTITSDMELAALGYSTNCNDSTPGNGNGNGNGNNGAVVSEEIEDLNIILIFAVAAAILLFFCVCGIISIMRKNPATSFDHKMYETYDADLGGETGVRDGEAAVPSPNNFMTTV